MDGRDSAPCSGSVAEQERHQLAKLPRAGQGVNNLAQVHALRRRPYRARPHALMMRHKSL